MSSPLRRPRDPIQYKEYIKDPIKSCEVCGKQLLRRDYGNSCFEALVAFEKRKVCSSGERKRSECHNIYYSGKGNTNYRGYLGTCLDCGKRTSYNTQAVARATGKHNNDRCKKCFKKWAKKTDYYRNTPQAKLIIERAKNNPKKAIAALLKWHKKHGYTAHNKLYGDNSRCLYCERKPVAKQMCHMHWQRNRKLVLMGSVD